MPSLRAKTNVRKIQVEKELTAALREFSLATAADVHCYDNVNGDDDVGDKGDGDICELIEYSLMYIALQLQLDNLIHHCPQCNDN